MWSLDSGDGTRLDTFVLESGQASYFFQDAYDNAYKLFLSKFAHTTILTNKR